LRGLLDRGHGVAWTRDDVAENARLIRLCGACGHAGRRQHFGQHRELEFDPADGTAKPLGPRVEPATPLPGSNLMQSGARA
jgi:hypothetical protein